ncbi:MAG: radical SAM protein [Alphaproteobacteria bacterium]|nr:radical SAM protein [Alphaproteobacteria bacterium]
MSIVERDHLAPMSGKFRNPNLTADGTNRASVRLRQLDTLWINTGTLCNLTCAHCYIESSPTNDRFEYITRGEVRAYLDEIRDLGLPTREIGLTGGEPFMNPDVIDILDDILSRGFEALVLTNAMTPMKHHQQALLKLHESHGDALTLRISVDHYTQQRHEEERGVQSWSRTIEGLQWLAQNKFRIAVAGRTMWHESEADLRQGYARLFSEMQIPIDAIDPGQLVIFPEMDEAAEVPEITTACWDLLNVNPDAMMCATSRMVVKRKGTRRPTVVSCTLLPYDKQFEVGQTLADATATVRLNHPHCARFCVLGGGSCSA